MGVDESAMVWIVWISTVFGQQGYQDRHTANDLVKVGVPTSSTPPITTMIV